MVNKKANITHLALSAESGYLSLCQPFQSYRKTTSPFLYFLSMASIGKAQAEALAEGFLDDIGSDPDGLQPRETLSELFLLAGELVEMAQDNLNDTKTNASGELSKSIATREPVAGPGFLQIDIEMNFYGQFVNSGVRGTRSGSGLYKFKHELGGRKKGQKGSGKKHKLVEAMIKYQKDARSKLTNVKVPIGYENKNSEIAKRASAYIMARSILQKGIKATYFMDKAIQETDRKVSERLGDALAIDVLNSLPDKL